MQLTLFKPIFLLEIQQLNFSGYYLLIICVWDYRVINMQVTNHSTFQYRIFA